MFCRGRGCIISERKSGIAAKCQEKLRGSLILAGTFFYNFTYCRRHIALMVAYLGWDLDGFCAQNNSHNTVESKIFKALIETKLIQSLETANYSRCGRTDKTVSAFSQVLSLDVRSNQTTGVGVFEPDGYCPNEPKPTSRKTTPKSEELDYAKILNSVLPQEIRVLAWAPVERTFNARYNCTSRQYKYFFPKGALNLKVSTVVDFPHFSAIVALFSNFRHGTICEYFQLMEQASKRLIGEHDFRNFCKIDMSKNEIQSCVRTVFDVQFTKVNAGGLNSRTLCCFTIVANAFLWHQIRCIMSVLFAIGEGKEQPDVIEWLLNTELCPAKPQYSMVVGWPLVLYGCQYDNLEWHWKEGIIMECISSLQRTWVNFAIKVEIIENMMNSLLSLMPNNSTTADLNTTSILHPELLSHSYRPLKGRSVGKSLEEKIVKKKKQQLGTKRTTTDNTTKQSLNEEEEEEAVENLSMEKKHKYLQLLLLLLLLKNNNIKNIVQN
ncbi:tRNA pseudouridine(38/39) synthase [Trichinella murrelli]|uniref:tRNA pseudouridine synthase n=1 Tax=Trichinella murrelli TaxID=144512 RepID=A0A0V0U7L2_9BILA|nr:tRNA pseudouridine(38/39) synthase [Trichinella murrelli]